MESGQKVSILLVDDNPNNLLALVSILEPLGYDLVEAQSGKEALEWVLKREFALILLDIQMPIMDGFETAALIRSMERGRHTPIIFITAIYQDDNYVSRGYSVGAVDYLVKPIDVKSLLAKVEVFVDLYKRTAEARRQKEQQEAETQAVRKRAADIIENITEGFITLDRQWYFTYLNREAGRFLEKLDITREELMKRRIWDEFPDLVDTVFQQRLERAFSEQVPGKFEYHFSPLNMWLEVSLYPSGGELSVYFRDITGSKRAERRLKAQQAVSSILAESPSLSDAITRILEAICENLRWEVGQLWIVDRRNNQLRCVENFHLQGNDYTEFQAMSSQTTFSPGTGLPGRVWSSGSPSWVPDIAVDKNFPRLNIATEKGLRTAFAFPILLGGETLGVIEFFSREVWQSDDKLIHMMATVGSQMGLFFERKRAEESLKESEERYRTVTETASDAIITIDDKSTILLANPAAEKIFGYSIEEMIGRKLTMMMPDYLRHLHEASPGLNPETGKRHAPRSNVEVPGLHKSGKEIPLELSFGEFKEGDRHIFSCIVRDVTERKQAEMELRQANQLKDEFLATVSHELRTPLTSILGWARLLRAGNLDEESVARAFETIERNAKLQTRIVDDLLDISKIITGKLVLQIDWIELLKVIEAAVDVIRPAADAKEIKLQMIVDPSVGQILGDATRLQQVIWNLLSNAVKFTPRHGSVQISLERVNSHVEITVTDNGKGIEPEFLPFVFERFRQADSSLTRTHGGLGLGLALVRYLVELHGGTVEVYSRGLEQGTTFTIMLPLMGVRREDQKQEQKQGQVLVEGTMMDCPPELTGLRVLLIDDDMDTLGMLSVILEQCNTEVKAATSVAEAMELMERWIPEIVVSDIGMPGEDGYELIRKIRALDPGRGGKIPAIALTAYAREEDRNRALLAGYNTHLTKPVEPSEFIVVIAGLAGRIGSR
jgi:PAS domain S-box-containing protein